MTHVLSRTRGRAALGATAVAITAIIALGACSGGSAGDSGTADLKLMDSTAPAKGDIDLLNWNLSTGEPDTLDPTNAITYSGGTVVSNLCDPLLRVKPDFSVQPYLATYEQPSPTQIVFTVRDDAKFWDGTPVTAEDVAFSLERSSDPARITSFIFAKVKSITSSGSDVVVDFNEPDELFIKEMAGLAASVVKKDFVGSAGNAFGTPETGIMCSGPLKLEKWASGDSITAVRNEDYWNEEYRARPAKVRYSFITDSTAITQALNAGEIDGSYELPPETITSLRKSSTGTLRIGPSLSSTGISVSHPDGPLADLKLREALQSVIDREALAKVVYKGTATPLYTTVTPTTWEPDAKAVYQPAYEKFAADRAFNVDKATKLVKESNYDGSTIVLAIRSGDATQNQIGQLVQQQAKKAGINIRIKAMQSLEYDQGGYDPSKREGIDLRLESSFNGVQDPVEPIGFLYLPEAFYNHTEFNDPEVTKLISQIQTSSDADERAKLFVEAQARYEPEQANIPLLTTNTISFVKKDYAGVITSWAYWSSPSQALIGAAE